MGIETEGRDSLMRDWAQAYFPCPGVLDGGALRTSSGF